MKTRLVLAAFGLAAAGAVAFLMVPPERPTDRTGPLDDYDQLVFVPDAAAPKVAVIDNRAGRVVATIATDGPPASAVVSETTRLLATVHREAGALGLYDLHARAAVPPVMLGLTPDEAVLSPDGTRIAVRGGGTVAVVSLVERRVVARAAGFAPPLAVTFALDGGRLYITDAAGGRIHVVETEHGTEVDTVAVGDGRLSALTRTPDGRLGFVSLVDAGRVAVVDLVARRVMTILGVGPAPGRPYGTAYGKFMLIPNRGDGTVSVISMVDLSVVATLPGGARMVSIGTGWFETTAAVVSAGDDKVVVLDLDKRAVVADIPLVGGPSPGVVTPDGRTVYVALAEAGAVAVIDLETRRLVRRIDGVGGRPIGAVMGRSNNYCH